MNSIFTSLIDLWCGLTFLLFTHFTNTNLYNQPLLFGFSDPHFDINTFFIRHLITDYRWICDPYALLLEPSGLYGINSLANINHILFLYKYYYGFIGNQTLIDLDIKSLLINNLMRANHLFNENAIICHNNIFGLKAFLYQNQVELDMMHNQNLYLIYKLLLSPLNIDITTQLLQNPIPNEIPPVIQEPIELPPIPVIENEYGRHIRILRGLPQELRRFIGRLLTLHMNNVRNIQPNIPMGFLRVVPRRDSFAPETPVVADNFAIID